MAGQSQSRTKKESQDSLKRSESELSLAEFMHSDTKPKITKKKKSDELETSSARDPKLPSAIGRSNEVILALSCQTPIQKKVASRKPKKPSTSENHNSEHKVVSNEEVPVNKSLDGGESEQVCTVQPKKKRKKEVKNEEVQKKDETLSGSTETPLERVLKTYKRKGKKIPLENNLDEKRDKGLDETSLNYSGVLKKKRSKREAHTDNTSKNISRHNFSDDCLPQWNDGDSSKVQKTVHKQSREDSRIDCKGNGSLSLLEKNGLSRNSSSHGVNVASGHGSPSELYEEGRDTSTPNNKMSSIDKSSVNHSNALEKKNKIRRKSKAEYSSDLATVQELCKEGHNTSSRNCRSVSVDEPPVNLLDKKSESKKKLKKEKKKHASHVGKSSDDLSTLDSSADQPDCAFSEGIVTKSSNEYHEEEVVPSVRDAVKVVPEIKNNLPDPHSSKVKSKQDTASESCEAGHNSLSRNRTIFSVDKSPVNLPDKKSESKKKPRKDKRKHTSQDVKDSDDLLNVERSVEQPEISSAEGTVTKISHEYPAVGEGKHDAVMLDTEIKENTSYSHTSKEKSQQDITTELRGEGHNASSNSHKLFSIDESSGNLPDKRSELRKRPRKDKMKHTYSSKHSHDLSNVDHSADRTLISLVEGTVTKSLNQRQEGEVISSIGEVKNDAVMLGTEMMVNTPYPHTSREKSGQNTVSELCEDGLNTLSMNCTMISRDEPPVNLPDKISVSRKRLRKDKRKHTSHDAKDSEDLSNLDCSAEQPRFPYAEGTVMKSLNEGHKEEVVPSMNCTPISVDESPVNLPDKISESRKRLRKDKRKHTLLDSKDSKDLSNLDCSAGQSGFPFAEGTVIKSLNEDHKEEVVPSMNCTPFSVDESPVYLPDKISESRKRLRKDKRTHTSHDAKDSEDFSNLDCSAEQPRFPFAEGTAMKSLNEDHKEEVAPSMSTLLPVDESLVNLPDKISESRKRLRKDKRIYTSHDAKDSEDLSNLDCSAEQPGFPFAEGTATKFLNEDHKEEVVPSMSTPLPVDECLVSLPDKISESRKRLRKDKRTHTSHDAKDFEDLSNLDCSAEPPGFPFAEGTATKSLHEDCKEEVVPSMSTPLPVDESHENLPDKISESRKRLRKDKREHTSQDAKDSEDVPNLDCSAKQPGFPFADGTITKSLNEDHKEEVVPSIGDIKNDALIVGTDIKQNKLVERSASPARALVAHMPKKLLVLDLNGLLVDIVSSLPEGYKADKRIAKKALLKRPFCDDFIRFCFERFNVGVWSSRTKKNVDSVIDFIMGDMRRRLLFCWHQSHCTRTGFSTVEDEHKPMVFKELKKLWEKWEPGLPWVRGKYNESNTLLLDDSPYKALLNPRHTAIFPYSYDFRNADDNSLGPGGDLRVYLEKISAAEHVQKYVEQNPFGQRAVTSKNPSWVYYNMVINANRLCLPT